MAFNLHRTWARNPPGVMRLRAEGRAGSCAVGVGEGDSPQSRAARTLVRRDCPFS